MDLDLIRREGELTKAAGERAWRHALVEKLSDIRAIMETVSGKDGDITYAVPTPGPHGEMTVPTGTTRQDAEDHYLANYAIRNHVKWEAFVELRKPWYAFFEGVEHYVDLPSGELTKGHSLAFFQLSDDAGDGIQGEMPWQRYPELPGYIARTGEDARQTGPGSLPLSKAENLALFRRLMDGLRGGDPAAVLATMCDDPQCAIRNYVGDCQPPFIALAGADALNDYLARFNEAYAVEELDLASIVTDYWYIFAELRWVVRERGGEGRRRTFHTAEFLPVSDQGRFVARVGFGTPFL